MNRWRVGEDRGSKEKDRCPLTVSRIQEITEVEQQVIVEIDDIISANRGC
jgi:hypothetical protein